MNDSVRCERESEASSFRLPNHHAPRFISSHPVALMVRVLMVVLVAAAIGGPIRRAATPGFAVKQNFATGANPRSAQRFKLKATRAY